MTIKDTLKRHTHFAYTLGGHGIMTLCGMSVNSPSAKHKFYNAKHYEEMEKIDCPFCLGFMKEMERYLLIYKK